MINGDPAVSLISYFRGAYQLGYVARDLDRVVDFLRTKMGAREVILREPELPVTLGNKQQRSRCASR